MLTLFCANSRERARIKAGPGIAAGIGEAVLLGPWARCIVEALL